MASEAFTAISTKYIALLIGIAIVVAIWYFNILTLLGLGGILYDKGLTTDILQKKLEEFGKQLEDAFKQFIDSVINSIRWLLGGGNG